MKIGRFVNVDKILIRPTNDGIRFEYQFEDQQRCNVAAGKIYLRTSISFGKWDVISGDTLILDWNNKEPITIQSISSMFEEMVS